MPTASDQPGRAVRPGAPGVIVCRRCGAVHPLEPEDLGAGVLAKLASVGLGAGAPPVLRTDRGSD